MFQPGADEAKGEVWKLNPRNTYVVVSNNVDVIPGVWEDNPMHKLKGGWNVLSDVDFNNTGGSCNQDSSSCFPIKASSGKVSVVCL